MKICDIKTYLLLFSSLAITSIQVNAAPTHTFVLDDTSQADKCKATGNLYVINAKATYSNGISAGECVSCDPTSLNVDPRCYCEFSFSSTYGKTDLPEMGKCRLPLVKLNWNWEQDHSGGHDHFNSDEETVEIEPPSSYKLETARLEYCEIEDHGWRSVFPTDPKDINPAHSPSCGLDLNSSSEKHIFAFPSIDKMFYAGQIQSLSSHVHSQDSGADSYRAGFSLYFRNLTY